MCEDKFILHKSSLLMAKVVKASQKGQSTSHVDVDLWLGDLMSVNSHFHQSFCFVADDSAPVAFLAAPTSVADGGVAPDSPQRRGEDHSCLPSEVNQTRTKLCLVNHYVSQCESDTVHFLHKHRNCRCSEIMQPASEYVLVSASKNTRYFIASNFQIAWRCALLPHQRYGIPPGPIMCVNKNRNNLPSPT